MDFIHFFSSSCLDAVIILLRKPSFCIFCLVGRLASEVCWRLVVFGTSVFLCKLRLDFTDGHRLIFDAFRPIFAMVSKLLDGYY